MLARKVDMIIDLQFGSTGKGLIAGYLAKKNHYDLIISANMPNAGHTFIDENGDKYIHHILPNGAVANPAIVAIGPGSVFDPVQLEKEWQFLIDHACIDSQLVIHPCAVPLKGIHKTTEEEWFGGDTIGSTKQGSAAAMVEKIRRSRSEGANWPQERSVIASDYKDEWWTENVATVTSWDQMVKMATSILIEGSQGYSLGINAGFWPFCTSRECTPARFMVDCAVPLPFLRQVIGTARIHPIRVGGNSGPVYNDHEEITFESLGVEDEVTTTTQRKRRVFTFSKKQMREAMFQCQPNKIFLNFCNYAPDEVDDLIDWIDFAGAETCMDFYGVRYTGWGATELDIKDTDFTEEFTQ